MMHHKFENQIFKKLGSITLQRWARGVTLSSLFAYNFSFAAMPAATPLDGALVSTTEAKLKRITYENELVTIEVDKDVPYRIFSMARPPRLVVELSKTLHGSKPYEARVDDPHLKSIRSAQFKHSPENITRIVLDLPKLEPFQSEKNGNQILVRLNKSGGVEETPEIIESEDMAQEMTGEDAFSLEAAAAETKPAKGTKPKARDLLSALPKNPVTIDFDDADIRDVLRVMSEMSNINMIYTNDLRGFVTVHLDQVPFNEVFSTVLSLQGLVAQQMGNNILRILTPEALNVDRSRSVTTYKTFPINYGKASEIVAHLGAVKISPNNKVTVDERNNALIVTDTPEGIAAAERLITELDKKPAQVLIETKVVQIDLNKSLSLGVQWEYTNVTATDPSGYNRRIIGQRERKETSTIDAGKVGFPSVGTTLEGEPVRIIENPFPVSSRGTGVNLPGPQSAGITFGFINNTDILTLTLNALETSGQTKTLTNPKIVTTNNQSAHIQIGSKVPFTTTTVSGTIATQSTTFVDVGFIINVTPTINVDNRVRLKVKPEVSEVTGTSDAGPTIGTTTAETEVILRDGETLVIGGLVSEKMIESASKVPLLGDLPVLGTFFRNSRNDKIRREILVFVTARIVPD